MTTYDVTFRVGHTKEKRTRVLRAKNYNDATSQAMALAHALRQNTGRPWGIGRIDAQ